MTDIVERLRGNAIGNQARIPWPHRLLHDAADYIEAQRGALKARNDSIVKQADEITRLRAALDRAADRFWDAGMNDEWADARAALAQGGDNAE